MGVPARPDGRAFLCLGFLHRLYRPLRGHARSHRHSTTFKACAVPVGAGVPAKRPVQPPHSSWLNTKGATR
ncbi:hypothetical protein CQW31_27835 [Pseudomonas sp. 382]|nr:hypothetical protein DZC31_07275 [Stenotrophomonas rhizophila]PIK75326.1 hypothetical protein CQW31_27835 [Pseudomonas sp. 382]